MGLGPLQKTFTSAGNQRYLNWGPPVPEVTTPPIEPQNWRGVAFCDTSWTPWSQIILLVEAREESDGNLLQTDEANLSSEI